MKQRPLNAHGFIIEWTDATWNPVTGCSVVSPGCTNCYAMKLAGTRLQHHQEPRRADPRQQGRAGVDRRGAVQRALARPAAALAAAAPIFVCAHGDLFHESVPDEWIDRVFAVMALAPQHTFQVLTKRARSGCGRIPLLLQCPAAVRWISAEPLLGPVDLMAADYLTAKLGAYPFKNVADEHRTKLLHMLDWVVAGGESGTGARPMHPEWARSLRDQCAAAGVPFLFKQWGSWRPISQGDSDWHDTLYRSRRRARWGQSQEAMDDCYGRECTVDNVVLQADGAVAPDGEPNAYRHEAMLTFRVGKKAAGRLLDGMQHDGYPEARP
jgi:protein gp37